MPLVEKEIGTGDAAAKTTVRDMCRLAARDSAHPLVRSLAQRLKKGKSDREAVRSALEHVVKAVPYKSDPVGVEWVVAPIYSLGLVKPTGEVAKRFRKGGDCDDQATALGALLLAMGYRAKMKIIAWRIHDYTHVYVVAILPDGTRIPCDCVMGNWGFNREKNGIRRSWEHECMKQITLEDGPGGCGCGCGGHSPSPGSGLSGACKCGGKCGGRCGKKKGCCPQNANHAHNASPVNVIVNSGSIDANQNWANNSRYSGGGSGSRLSREVIREKPIIYNRRMVMQKTVRPVVRLKQPDITLPRPKMILNQVRQMPATARKVRPKRVRYTPAFY